MDKIRLWIAVSDPGYRQALGRIAAALYEDFTVSLEEDSGVQDEETVIKTSLEEERWDLILVDEERKKRLLQRGVTSPKLIGLTGDRNVGEKKDWLYQFQPVSSIMAELRYQYGRLTGKCCLPKEGSGMKLIGFCSACGGVGKSAAALGTARELASFPDAKVLYLSAEAMESTEIYMGKGGRRSLGDYLYYLLTDEERNMASYLDAFLFRDAYGVEALSPSQGRNELKSLDRSQLALFLKTVYQVGRHQYICLDLDWDGSEQAVYLLECCDLIFLIDDGRMPSRYKNEKLMRYLSLVSDQNWEEKVVKVTNGWTEEDELTGRQMVGGLSIERDEGSFTVMEDRVDIGIHRGFGLGVRNLAAEIRRRA